MRAYLRREPPPRLIALLAAAALVGSTMTPASAASPDPSPPGPSSPNAASAPSPTTVDTAAQAQAAKERYARGDFAGAASIYEALWESTHAPKYIYNAGMAREAAGQPGLAVRHWRRFLASAGSDVTPAERAELRSRADVTAAENPVLEVQLEPASAFGPSTVLTLQPPPELVAAGLVPINLRDPIAGDIDEASARVRTSLDPGIWILSLSGLRGAPDQTLTIEIPPGSSRTIRPIALTARRVTFSVRTAPRLWLHPGADVIVTQGGAPLQRIHLRGRPVDITAPEGPVEITATADGYLPAKVPLDLHLERPTAPVTLRLRLDDRRTRLGLGLGLGLPGLVLLATGSTFAAIAADKLQKSPRPDPEYSLQRNLGALVAGMGGGLLVSSTMGIIRPRSPRRWIIGSSLGGALAIAGFGAYGGLKRAFDQESYPPRQDYLSYSAARATTRAVSGLGLGLLTGSLTGLLTHLIQDRAKRRSR